MRWRLLPPAIGQVLQVAPHWYLTVPWFALVALVSLSIHYALRFGATPWGAGSVRVIVGTSSAFFSASCAVGYSDSLCRIL